MKNFFNAFMLVFVLGFSYGAFALDTVTVAPKDAVIDGVLDVVMWLVALGLAAVAAGLAKKVGLELDQRKAARTIFDVINSIEERAKLSEKLGEKVPSKEKQEKAVAKVMAKIPGITQEEAEDRVMAALREAGLGASNSFRVVAEVATNDTVDESDSGSTEPEALSGEGQPSDG